MMMIEEPCALSSRIKSSTLVMAATLTATVEVTDRGPFIRGRNLDVSYGVARKLGMVDRGVTKLRMSKVQEQSPNRLSSATLGKPKLYL